MKTLKIPCNCGMKGCSTELELREDDENRKNILMVIRDDKHDVDIFTSLNSDSVDQLIRVLQTRYKRKS